MNRSVSNLSPMRQSRRMVVGFTLIEVLTVLAVIGLISYASMSAFKMVQPTARRSALQELAAALDEARTTALRKGGPSPFFIRRGTNELGDEGVREFGVERQMGDATVLLWRRLPGQVVLSTALLSSPGKRVVNIAALKSRSISQFDIPGLSETGSQMVGGLVFGEDGEVVYPDAETSGQADLLGLLVAHEVEDLNDHDKTGRHARIEIHPGTGRALVLE